MQETTEQQKNIMVHDDLPQRDPYGTTSESSVRCRHQERETNHEDRKEKKTVDGAIKLGAQQRRGMDIPESHQ